MVCCWQRRKAWEAGSSAGKRQARSDLFDFPSLEAAEAVGRELVERRLAACVNILPGMTSIYRWEGAIARDSEVVMIIKTRQSLVRASDRGGEVRATATPIRRSSCCRFSADRPSICAGCKRKRPQKIGKRATGGDQ